MVHETGEFEARSERSRREPKRRSKSRRRGRTLDRGGILSALHEASLELFSAHVDAMTEIVSSYRDRHEGTRNSKSDNHWIFDMRDNVNDSLWDGYDRLVDIPKRTRRAYLDERDRDDRDDD